MSASLNLHPSSSLHHAGLGPVVLTVVDGKCEDTVELATQTDSEIQPMLTAQHQLGQHLHPNNVQHHIHEFAVKSPDAAVPGESIGGGGGGGESYKKLQVVIW